VVAGAAQLKPKLVIFSGPPGTGKSTLADEIARDLGAPNIGWDWLMAGLRPFPAIQSVVDAFDRDTTRDVGYSLMSQMVEKQLRNSQSVVLDCVVRERARARWVEIAAQYGAPVFVVECVCSDADVHRSRIVGRVRAIPGWDELDWKFVEISRNNYEPLGGDKLVVDALDPLTDNLARVRAYVERGPADEPTGS
jgi:predicted kinase